MATWKDKQEKERLSRLRSLEDDPFHHWGAVLRSSDIIYLCEEIDQNSTLIEPFERENLKPAGYKLTVGDEFYLRGQHSYLPESRYWRDGDKLSESIRIPPFEVAIIKTAETLCIPRFLIARWNIVVKLAYKGLLWVGGPQVDPGWKGHLCCPIYNLSENYVELRQGDDLALMDFVRTAPFEFKGAEDPKRWEVYDPDVWTIEAYQGTPLISALSTLAAERIREVRKEQGDLVTRLNWFTTLMIAALATIPAILVAFLPFPGASVGTASVWGPIAVGLSVFAALVVLTSLLPPGVSQYMARRAPTSALFHVIAVLVAVAAFIWMYSQTGDAHRDLVGAIRTAGLERISQYISGSDTQRSVQNASIAEIEVLRSEVAALQEQLEEAQGEVESSTQANLEAFRTADQSLREELAALRERILELVANEPESPD